MTQPSMDGGLTIILLMLSQVFDDNFLFIDY